MIADREQHDHFVTALAGSLEADIERQGHR